MMTIGERIALIIQKNNLKNVQFAEKLGISGAYVTHLVKGKNAPSDALVKLICREFHVREDWLLTEQGPMDDTEPMTPLTEYAQERGMTPFEERMIHAWFDLPPDIRQMLMVHFRQRLADGKDILEGLDVYAGQSSVPPVMAEANDQSEEECLSKEDEQEGKIPAASIPTAIRNGQDIIRGMTRAEYHARLDQQLDAEQEEDRKRIQVLPQSGRGASGNDSPAHGSASTGTGGGVA